MRLSQMGRVGLFSLAIAPLVGTSVSFGDSQWTMLIGLALILLAAGIVIGVQTARSRRKYPSRPPEPKLAGEKVSNQLVVLSSAAILAVYGAGYFRTNAAARVFAEQTAQMRLAAALATGSLPATAPPRAKANPAGPSSQISQSVSSTRPGEIASPRPSPASAAAVPTKRTSGSAKSKDSEPLPSSGAQTSDQQAAAAAPPPAPSLYKDGTYTGWGSCPHGRVQASIVIASGLIVAADVAQCQTQYPCSMLDKLTNEVVYQQTPDVDVVTGATESAYAFHVAVTQALAQAMSDAK